jgi:hypothetical protein
MLIHIVLLNRPVVLKNQIRNSKYLPPSIL